MRLKRTYILIGFVGFAILSLLVPIPDPLFDTSYATVMESKEGQLLGARIAEDEQWRFPPIDSLPDNYIKCLLEFEDRYFYIHLGINPISIVRAIKQNIKAGKIVSGGSTITMQIARMALGNKPRTISQKIIELYLAIRIELKYSKDEILELYANNAPFGGNVVGISAAAWRYYGRSPFHLSWAEAANLAILPNSPGIAYPGKKEAKLLKKRNRILAGLRHDSIIDSSTFLLSKAEPFPQRPKQLPNIASHLLDRCKKEGLAQTTIKSSIDISVQKTVNELVKTHYIKYKFKQIHNVAALVADINTGEVKAYVGNANVEKNLDHGQQVDIITSRRSPGSLLKPILYALAIDEGIITPNQLLPDIPVYFQGFTPQNFDKKFKGAVPANLALRSSLNVPFVGLLKMYGYEKFHYKLNKLGLSSFDKPASHYGLSMILGGGEVTLWEIAGLYASMARNLNNYNSRKGNLRYHSNNFKSLTYLNNNEGASKLKTKNSKVSASATWHMLQAMQELRRPDANWEQYSSSKTISWKTGTSYGHKDAWAIGINSGYVVAAWVGNADGEGRPDLVGVSAAAPLMFRIFESLPESTAFQIPFSDMKMMKICQQSGAKASAICPDTDNLPITKSVASTGVCRHHQILHLDETNKYMVNSVCYPIHKMHEEPWFILPPAQAWYYKKYNMNYAEPPDYLAGCISRTIETIEMIYPKKFTRVFVPTEIDGRQGEVVFEAAHRNPKAKVFWYLDDEYIGETRQVHQIGLHPSEGSHQLSLVDDQGMELNIAFEAINDSN